MKYSFIPDLIKATRLKLGENQVTFGKRFGTATATAVSYWEAGIREAPYSVIEFVLAKDHVIKICPTCEGRGVIYE